MTPGPWQIVIIVAVILLLFGAGRIADLGKGLGEGIRNFKKGISDDDKGGDKDDPKRLASKDESTADTAQSSDRKKA